MYVHNKGNVKEVWVELEFKPWLNSYLDGILDQDHDGYPEVVARLDPRVFTQEMVAEITGDYSTRLLGEPQVIDWSRNLASRWYPSYNTDLLPLKAGSAWPYEDTPEAYQKGNGRRMGFQSLCSSCKGIPFADTLYNVFEVEGMGNAKPETEKRKEGKPVARGLDKGLTQRLEAITARIDKENKAYGGGRLVQMDRPAGTLPGRRQEILRPGTGNRFGPDGGRQVPGVPPRNRIPAGARLLRARRSRQPRSRHRRLQGLPGRPGHRFPLRAHSHQA